MEVVGSCIVRHLAVDQAGRFKTPDRETTCIIGVVAGHYRALDMLRCALSISSGINPTTPAIGTVIGDDVIEYRQIPTTVVNPATSIGCAVAGDGGIGNRQVAGIGINPATETTTIAGDGRAADFKIRCI